MGKVDKTFHSFDETSWQAGAHDVLVDDLEDSEDWYWDCKIKTKLPWVSEKYFLPMRSRLSLGRG